MPIVDEVSAGIVDAMRRQERTRLGALRMLKAAFMNRAVEAGHELNEDEARQVVRALVKQRKDSIEQFEKGGRPDLVEKEAAELAILETFLPPPVDPQAIEQAVADAIRETGATSMKDMGRVMKAAMSRLATITGQTADGKAVNELVRTRLSEL
jgi:uncharacterized protein YqeY